MSKKRILFIGALMLGSVAFAGGDLNLSSDIPVCTPKIVERYDTDPQNEVRDIILRISENENLIQEEYSREDKNWDEIQRLTMEGGELKGELEYIILSRN